MSDENTIFNVLIIITIQNVPKNYNIFFTKYKKH